MHESYREIAPIVDYDSILHRDVASERCRSSQRWDNTAHPRKRWPLRRDEMPDESEMRPSTNVITCAGDTLVEAVDRADIGEVARLMRGGAPLFAKYNLDAEGLNRGTLLEFAQSRGDEKMAMRLLALPHYGPNLARVSTRAVNWAARDGQSLLLKQLLAARADVTQKDNWERSALLLAAMHGHTDCVSELLEAGANDPEKHKTEVRHWMKYWKERREDRRENKPERRHSASSSTSRRRSLTWDGEKLTSTSPLQPRNSTYN